MLKQGQLLNEDILPQGIKETLPCILNNNKIPPYHYSQTRPLNSPSRHLFYISSYNYFQSPNR